MNVLFHFVKSITNSNALIHVHCSYQFHRRKQIVIILHVYSLTLLKNFKLVIVWGEMGLRRWGERGLVRMTTHLIVTIYVLNGKLKIWFSVHPDLHVGCTEFH